MKVLVLSSSTRINALVVNIVPRFVHTAHPRFNENTKKMEKCTFCVHRVLNEDRSALTGLKPACVNTCIGKALDFGENVGNTGDAPSGFASRDYTNPSVTFDWGWIEPW